MARDVLMNAKIEVVICQSVGDMCDRINEGCAALIVAEEALRDNETSLLKSALNEQPAWSDLPIIFLTSKMSGSENPILSVSGNVSILERPFTRFVLISTVEMAIRARRKQYHSKQVITVQREAAVRRDEFFANALA